MSEINIDEIYTLARMPFLLRGVIVQHNSKVKVLRQSSDGSYVVLYTDREGYTHEIENIKKEELI